MEYKKLCEMKKRFFSFRDTGINYVIDCTAIKEAVNGCTVLNDLSGGYPSSMLASLVSGNINTKLGLYPHTWELGGFCFHTPEGRKYEFMFESERVCVYSQKTGKQLYQFIKITALRVWSWRPGAWYNEINDFYTVFGRWSTGSAQNYDVEIAA